MFYALISKKCRIELLVAVIFFANQSKYWKSTKCRSL